VSSLLEKADQTYKQQQFMKAGLESMLQSIKERRSMTGLAAAAVPVPSTSSIPGIPSGVGSLLANGGVSSGGGGLAISYSTAAANAINNNLAAGVNGGPNNNMGGSSIISIGGGNVAAAAAALSAGTGGPITLTSSSGSSVVLKNVQSLAYCYAIDCKSSYEELNRLMRVRYMNNLYSLHLEE
jgi:hypothetical protein